LDTSAATVTIRAGLPPDRQGVSLLGGVPVV